MNISKLVILNQNWGSLFSNRPLISAFENEGPKSKLGNKINFPNFGSKSPTLI